MTDLLLAILSSTTVAVCMRLATRDGQQRTGLLAVNYLTCTLIAYAYADKSLSLWRDGLGNVAFMSVMMGVFYLAGFLLFQREMGKSGIVLSTIFMKLGLLVPVVGSVLLFREEPTVRQGIGFLLALTAIVLINLPDGKREGRFHGGLLLLLLTCGSGDLMSKVFEEWGEPRFREIYLTLAFGTAMLLCVIITALRREKPEKKDVLYGVLLGIPNYYASRFLLLALKSLPAVVVYPTFSVGTLAAVTALGICLFRERLRPRQWVAFGGILLALLLLNI